MTNDADRSRRRLYLQAAEGDPDACDAVLRELQRRPSGDIGTLHAAIDDAERAYVLGVCTAAASAFAAGHPDKAFRIFAAEYQRGDIGVFDEYNANYWVSTCWELCALAVLGREPEWLRGELALALVACDDPTPDKAVDLEVSADGAETETDQSVGADVDADSDADTEDPAPTEAQFQELAALVAELRDARTFSVFGADNNQDDERLDVSGALEMDPILSVDIRAPAAGNIVVSATVSFGFGEASAILCSIAQDETVHSDGARVYAKTSGPNDMVSLSATRGLEVGPGDRTTIHLLCNASGVSDIDAPEWHDAQIAAVFSPAP